LKENTKKDNQKVSIEGLKTALSSVTQASETKEHTKSVDEL